MPLLDSLTTELPKKQAAACGIMPSHSFRRDFRGFWLLTFCFTWTLQFPLSTAHADPVTDYNVAVEFYKQQRWDLAADASADFLKKYQNHKRAPTVRLYWAQSLLHLQKFQEAREQFQLFLKNAPDHADRPLAMYRIGECSYFLGNYAAAEADLARFLKAYPNHELAEWAIVYYGESLLRQKKYAAASRAFEASIKKFPQSRLLDDAEFGLASSLDALNESARAIEVYQRIVGRPNSPRAPEALFNIAAQEFDDGKFEQSAIRFQQVTTQFPHHRLVPAAHLNAGYAFYYLSKYPEAIEQFRKAAADPAHFSIATYWIGLSEKSEGQFEQAVKTFSSILKAKEKPDAELTEKLTFQWADAEFRQSHYSKAIELFLQVTQQSPQGELADDALHSACEAALQAGELELAQQLNQQFVKEFATSGLSQVQELLSARIQIAQADQAGTDSPAGQAALEQAMIVLKHVAEDSTVKTTREFAHFQLARVAERQGRDADVIAELKPLLESPQAKKSPDYRDAQLLRANAQLRLGDAAAALADYRKFMEVAKSEADRLTGYAGIVSALTALKDWKQLSSTLAEFDKFDQQDVRFSSSALTAGDTAFDLKLWSPAASIFQKIVDRGPEHSYYLPALSGLAHTQYEKGEYQLSAANFKKLKSEADPDAVLASHAGYMQALALQQAKELPEALAAYQSVAQEFKQRDRSEPLTTGEIEVGLNAYRSAKGGARLAREMKNIPLADELYQAAYQELKKQPEKNQTEMDLLINEWADLSYNAKDYERSDELYALLVKERPDSSLADDARLILAESLRFGNQKEKAISAFRQLADDPRSDEFVQQRSLIHLLDLYAEASNWKEVIAISQQIEKKFPGNSHELYVTYRRGEGLLQTRQFAESEKVLQQLRTKLSDDLEKAPAWWPEVWLLLAESQFWLKDYQQMEETVADLKAKAPDSPLLYRADAILGRGLENRARFPEARAAYRRVVDSEHSRGTETAAEAQFRIAESYLKENNLPVALREYYKVYAGYDAPKYESAALFQAAACDVTMKHYPQAIKTYQKLMTEFPDSEFAKKAEAKIKELEKISKS